MFFRFEACTTDLSCPSSSHTICSTDWGFPYQRRTPALRSPVGWTDHDIYKYIFIYLQKKIFPHQIHQVSSSILYISLITVFNERNPDQYIPVNLFLQMNNGFQVPYVKFYSQTFSGVFSIYSEAKKNRANWKGSCSMLRLEVHNTIRMIAAMILVKLVEIMF